MSARTRCLSYLRVSTAGQIDGDGFPRQRAAIARYVKAKRLVIEHEFTDEGVSGTLPLHERPGLSALLLLATAKDNDVRLIVVEKADRLSRDLIEGETILAEFRRHNVRIVEAEGGNELTASDNPTASLVRQILGSVAEFEKKALCAKMAAGRRRKREGGERCDGAKPFGMRPGEAETLELIRKIEQDAIYKESKNVPQFVADVLNKKKVATRSGRPWTGDVVRRILRRKDLEAAPNPK